MIGQAASRYLAESRGGVGGKGLAGVDGIGGTKTGCMTCLKWEYHFSTMGIECEYHENMKNDHQQ